MLPNLQYSVVRYFYNLPQRTGAGRFAVGFLTSWKTQLAGLLSARMRTIRECCLVLIVKIGTVWGFFY